MEVPVPRLNIVEEPAEQIIKPNDQYSFFYVYEQLRIMAQPKQKPICDLRALELRNVVLE